MSPVITMAVVPHAHAGFADRAIVKFHLYKRYVCILLMPALEHERGL